MQTETPERVPAPVTLLTQRHLERIAAALLNVAQVAELERYTGDCESDRFITATTEARVCATMLHRGWWTI